MLSWDHAHLIPSAACNVHGGAQLLRNAKHLELGRAPECGQDGGPICVAPPVATNTALDHAFVCVAPPELCVRFDP